MVYVYMISLTRISSQMIMCRVDNCRHVRVRYRTLSNLTADDEMNA